MGRLLPRRRAKESSEKEVEKCVEVMSPGEGMLVWAGTEWVGIQQPSDRAGLVS